MTYDYYLYIVRCSDGSYYTGVTNSAERRVFEHNEGFSPKSYTFTRRPVELVYCEHFQYIGDAIDCEKQIKRWSRKKKEALIRGDENALHELAACKNKSSYLYFERIKRTMKCNRRVVQGLLCRPSTSLGMTQEKRRE